MIQPPPAADSLRAVLDSVFAAPAYQWVERPHPLAFLARWWRLLFDWLGGLSAAHPALYQAVLWLLVLVAAAILAHAVWVIVQAVRTTAPPSGAPAPAGTEMRDAAWHRGEAERLAAGGRYTEAVQEEFLALVLRLDARRALRFHPSKTPAEYAGEIRLPDQGRGDFRGLVENLYRYAFAGVPCTAGDYLTWKGRAELALGAASD